MSDDPLEKWVDENSSLLSNSVDRQSASIVNVESSRNLMIVALCAALCGASVVLGVWSAFMASHAEKESRLVEYYLMDPNYRTEDELRAWARFKEDRK